METYKKNRLNSTKGIYFLTAAMETNSRNFYYKLKLEYNFLICHNSAARKQDAYEPKKLMRILKIKFKKNRNPLKLSNSFI